MCLYIITQLTGAALHIAQDERERERQRERDRERERLLTHFMFLSVDESMFTLLTAHSTRSLKSILTLFHSFQKPTADVSLQKIIYVKTKW